MYAGTFWTKIVAGGALAGIVGAGGAAVNSVVNTSRLGRAEAEVRDLDERQRQLTSDVAALKTDVGYSRRALDRLLWHQGIPLPPEDGGEPYVSSSE